MARPAGDFNAERYFRGDYGLRFYNIGTKPMRAFARSIHLANRESWSIDDAMALADELISDPYLETKSVGIEIVACYRRDFAPNLLARWKRWLSRNHSANWATTDAGSSGTCSSTGRRSRARRCGMRSNDFRRPNGESSSRPGGASVHKCERRLVERTGDGENDRRTLASVVW
jgi:hypothetical protein